ncbi:MAG: hypothetical protein LBB85_10340 [Dysgonamonadaceae bacterium]|jgi:phosphate transport system protein|nr:hypothetical protein [Dysgonamonadaceae bacterium]
MQHNITQENFNGELEKISIALIHQITCIESLIATGWQDSVYRQLVENEKIIDTQEDLFIKNFTVYMALMSPKVKLLRKIISIHEAILFMEIMSDLMVDIADSLKKIKLNKPELEALKNDLQHIFDILKTIVQMVTFGFFKEDMTMAYPVIEKNKAIEKRLHQIQENLMDFYRAIPLDNDKLQHLLDLSRIIYLVEKIQKFTINIAKLIIFVTEGTNIRHQRFEK